jgi:pimeloyl-ACP methyl ester carboxylesterase
VESKEVNPVSRLSHRSVRERGVDLEGARVRVLDVGPTVTGNIQVVVVPGLGALGYLLPMMRALGREGAACTLLDLPGFGSRAPLPGSPTVHGVAELTATFVQSLPSDAPIILVGHSTGAQAALHAAVRVQDSHRPAAVVLAGPTITPGQRSLPRLMARAPAAYRRDSPRELIVVPDYLRGRRHVLTLLRSAMRDRPEDTVAGLRAPLTVTAGRSDAFAPRWWLEALAGRAVRSSVARVKVLPGSHNNPYTHPARFTAVVLESPL